MSRDSVETDVVVVGGGPAGLAAAIRLKQLAASRARPVGVSLLEKGSEIGAHILSGAVMDLRALHELLPDWHEREAPLETPVTHDRFYFLTGPASSLRVPRALVPSCMHNDGNHIVSLGNLCRWLAAQAEALGVEIYPGFAAASVLFDGGGAVAGVITGDAGVSAQGEQKDSYAPGMELRARFTLFAEGCRGHLGREVIRRFRLAEGCDPQHYGIGIKEIWDVRADRHEPGLVVHGAGWPLAPGASGGFFLYHLQPPQVAVGLIADLNYANPHFDPFAEFQRFKAHPAIRAALEGGRRVTYGARAITKGGWNSLPRLSMPGALLAGCDAGTLNFARIKGIHTAMKSGMLAAEAVFEALEAGGGNEVRDFDARLRSSWLYDELYRARNFGPALHRLGLAAGSAFNFIDQTLFRGRLPVTLHDPVPDHAALRPAGECRPIDYPNPDGVLSFDRMSSVYLSNTNHAEDQPCHLRLADPALALSLNLARYAAPEQRYCPAGVYEIVQASGGPRLQINAQNCVHCKTCDIKDPAQNITWVPPEGGGGPNYPNM